MDREIAAVQFGIVRALDKAECLFDCPGKIGKRALKRGATTKSEGGNDEQKNHGGR